MEIPETQDLSDKLEKDPGQVFSVEDILDDSVKISNRWEMEESTPGIDKLSLTAKVQVSAQGFKAANPGIDLDHLDISKTYNYETYQSQIDSGWHVDKINKDNSIRLGKKNELKVNHGNHSGLAETVGNISEDHYKQVMKKIGEMPANVSNFLRDNGYKLLIAPSIVAALPELTGKKYRGWEFSFEYSDGTHDAEKQVMVAPEKVRNRETGKWENVDRPNVPIHQMSHALDAVFKRLNGEYLSQTKEFKESYLRDIAQFTDADRNSDVGKYLTQANGGGERETFASIAGLTMVGPENEEDKEVLERLFPNTIAYMKKLIPTIGQ